MPKITPKVGHKYLVRKDFTTAGNEQFTENMFKWRRTPVRAFSLWYEGGILVKDCQGREWVIDTCDLIPYRTPKLENK